MQSISPEIIFRGNGAWKEALPEIIQLTNRPLILGRSESTNNLRNKICKELIGQNLFVYSANLHFDCCQEDFSRIKKIILNNKCDSIIAAGGGKVLDAGKYLADCLSLPVSYTHLRAHET